MSRVVFFIAMRQLWDRKLLNGIAVCGVSLGVLTLIAINGIMQGFQHKFIDNILRISPHVTLFDRQLRPAPPLLARAYDGFVVTDFEERLVGAHHLPHFDELTEHDAVRRRPHLGVRDP